MKKLAFYIPFFLILYSCSTSEENTSEVVIEEDTMDIAVANELKYPQEYHLKNIRQLTYRGDNAEAYWGFDNNLISFQRTTKDENVPCDQIFYGKLPTKGQEFTFNMVSSGEGRTTCAFFMPDNKSIIYASTHLSGKDCPPEPDREKIRKYVWPIYDSYELFIADTAGNILKQMTNNKFYDAEATISPKGDKIVFTSNRSGDLELWTMNMDGSDLKQVTTGLGYDGGAFFSPDGTKLVFRSSRPKTEEEIKEYKELLAQGLVAPTNMEIYTCNIDGSGLKQITNLGKANWAPYYHPSGNKILFSSNHASQSGRTFNIFMINEDGTGLKQITFDDEFDSFPMFSFDGKYLMWSSNRNNGDTRDTNIFVAEWVD